MKKSFNDYLPKEEISVTIQVKIPVEIANETRKIIDAKKLTWKEVISACLKRFNDEMKG